MADLVVNDICNRTYLPHSDSGQLLGLAQSASINTTGAHICALCIIAGCQLAGDLESTNPDGESANRVHIPELVVNDICDRTQLPYSDSGHR